MTAKELTPVDSKFLSYLRSVSILIIVFGHVGGFWAFKPYTEFLHVFVPVFFFLSGAVSFFSYNRSKALSDYYKSRLISLLAPYYLLCILSIFVFIAMQGKIPSFDLSNLLLWLQIRPAAETTPFNVGQVWFLHTLFFITLASPVFFYYVNNNKAIVALIIFLTISASTIQMFADIDGLFSLFGNNIFKPVVHSCFFILGAVCFSTSLSTRRSLLFALMVSSLAVCVGLANSLDINIDFSHHTYAPDLYYVSGSLAAIFAAVILKEHIVRVVQASAILEKILYFFHKHTFSVYLLHSLAIFLAESLFGLVSPTEKTISYGLIKFAVVLAMTCIMAIPFTKLSEMAVTLTKNALTARHA